MKCQNCGAEVFVEDSKEFKPISMWGYFGYELLFSIPVIGFICLLIFAFGGKNKNVKNFARSYFCFMIVVFILAFIIGLIAGFAGFEFNNITKSSIL